MTAPLVFSQSDGSAIERWLGSISESKRDFDDAHFDELPIANVRGASPDDILTYAGDVLSHAVDVVSSQPVFRDVDCVIVSLPLEGSDTILQWNDLLKNLIGASVEPPLLLVTRNGRVLSERFHEEYFRVLEFGAERGFDSCFLSYRYVTGPGATSDFGNVIRLYKSVR